MIPLETSKVLTPLQNLPKNVGNLGKMIVAMGFEKLTQSAINRPIWSHCPQPSASSVNEPLPTSRACHFKKKTTIVFKLKCFACQSRKL